MEVKDFLLKIRKLKVWKDRLIYKKREKVTSNEQFIFTNIKFKNAFVSKHRRFKEIWRQFGCKSNYLVEFNALPKISQVL